MEEASGRLELELPMAGSRRVGAGHQPGSRDCSQSFQPLSLQLHP